MKFQKIPVTIEAVEWTGDNLVEITNFIEGKDSVDTSTPGWHDYVNIVRQRGLKIDTLEGNMSASVGDWIIKGVAGEFYPCKPDIFKQTYRNVD